MHSWYSCHLQDTSVTRLDGAVQSIATGETIRSVFDKVVFRHLFPQACQERMPKHFEMGVGNACEIIIQTTNGNVEFSAALLARTCLNLRQSWWKEKYFWTSSAFPIVKFLGDSAFATALLPQTVLMPTKLNVRAVFSNEK